MLPYVSRIIKDIALLKTQKSSVKNKNFDLGVESDVTWQQ